MRSLAASVAVFGMCSFVLSACVCGGGGGGDSSDSNEDHGCIPGDVIQTTAYENTLACEQDASGAWSCAGTCLVGVYLADGAHSADSVRCNWDETETATLPFLGDGEYVLQFPVVAVESCTPEVVSRVVRSSLLKGSKEFAVGLETREIERTCESWEIAVAQPTAGPTLSLVKNADKVAREVVVRVDTTEEIAADVRITVEASVCSSFGDFHPYAQPFEIQIGERYSWSMENRIPACPEVAHFELEATGPLGACTEGACESRFDVAFWSPNLYESTELEFEWQVVDATVFALGNAPASAIVSVLIP